MTQSKTILRCIRALWVGERKEDCVIVVLGVVGGREVNVYGQIAHISNFGKMFWGVWGCCGGGGGVGDLDRVCIFPTWLFANKLSWICCEHGLGALLADFEIIENIVVAITIVPAIGVKPNVFQKGDVVHS